MTCSFAVKRKKIKIVQQYGAVVGLCTAVHMLQKSPIQEKSNFFLISWKVPMHSNLNC